MAGKSVAELVELLAEPEVSSAEDVVSAGGSLPVGEKQCVQSVPTTTARRLDVNGRVMMSHQK